MSAAERAKRLLRAMWVAGAETLLGVVMVGVLSTLFLLALFGMFPKGSGLVDFYGGFVGTKSASTVARPMLADGFDQPIVAELTRVERQVRDRPPEAVVWSTSARGLAVQDQHAIQTFGRSGATIEIEGGEAIEMGENSLVVFRQPQRGRRGERRRASIALLGGEIRGAVRGERGTQSSLDIVTGNASTRVTGQDGEAVSYSIRVDPDHSSTIKVFSGQAEVTAGEGRRVLKSNEALTVFPDDTIGEPVPVPAAPLPIASAAGDAIVFGAVPPRVPFRWAAVTGADAYRLRIATDAALDEIVYDATQEATGFQHGALDSGTYYWTVSAMRGGVEGLSAPVHTVELTQDVEPPPLEVIVAAGAPGSLTVRGTTEPGATLYIGDTTLKASSSGTFVHSIAAVPGVNMIVIEAVDAVGNSSYYSEYVDENGRPRRSP